MAIDTTFELPRIALGTWPMDGRDWGEADDETSIRIVRRALDLGITLIDTAPVYGLGRCEEIVGRALEGHHHDGVTVATKVGIRWRTDGKDVEGWQDLSPASIRDEVEASLVRLRTEVLDLVQIHWPHHETPLEDTLAALLELRDEGKLLRIGVSNFDVPLLEQASAACTLSTLQPPHHLFFRNAEREILPWCAEHGLGTLVYGPLCKGLLTGKFRNRPVPEDIRRQDPFFGDPILPLLMGKVDILCEIAAEEGITPGQLALAWTLSRTGIQSAIVGARSLEQLEENAAAAAITLSADALAAVETCIADVPQVVPW